MEKMSRLFLPSESTNVNAFIRTDEYVSETYKISGSLISTFSVGSVEEFEHERILFSNNENIKNLRIQ
jgi:hypothetical protein